MIDISDISDFPSPDWSAPRRGGASAGVEGTKSLFPQAPPVPSEIVVVAPKLNIAPNSTGKNKPS